MKEMVKKFVEEFKSVYNGLLDADNAVCALDVDAQDDNTCFSVWGQYTRKLGKMDELYKVAEILGYTQDDIENWKNEVRAERN